MHELRLFGLHSTEEVRPGLDLVQWLLALCTRQEIVPEPGDILVLAQKIVSKSEGRQVCLADVEASDQALEMGRVARRDARICELMLRESTQVVRCTPHVVIMRHKTGVVLANAGIDRSNVEQQASAHEDGRTDETVLLWPTDPDASARALHEQASRRLGFALPVIINDSLGRAWRRGTVGTAIGAAGLSCLLDLRGKPDRHGFRLQTSELGAADELAAAASILMGQADESVPAVLLRGVRVPASPTAVAADLIRPMKEDLFP